VVRNPDSKPTHSHVGTSYVVRNLNSRLTHSHVYISCVVRNPDSKPTHSHVHSSYVVRNLDSKHTHSHVGTSYVVSSDPRLTHSYVHISVVRNPDSTPTHSHAHINCVVRNPDFKLQRQTWMIEWSWVFQVNDTCRLFACNSFSRIQGQLGRVRKGNAIQKVKVRQSTEDISKYFHIK
jgi:hypothetical protein